MPYVFALVEAGVAALMCGIAVCGALFTDRVALTPFLGGVRWFVILRVRALGCAQIKAAFSRWVAVSAPPMWHLRFAGSLGPGPYVLLSATVLASGQFSAVWCIRWQSRFSLPRRFRLA